MLDEAIRRRLVCTIQYVDSHGAATERMIEPIQFANTDDHWYVMAYCRLRDDGRWFRLDRIEDATLTTETPPSRNIEELFGEVPADARPVSVTEWMD